MRIVVVCVCVAWLPAAPGCARNEPAGERASVPPAPPGATAIEGAVSFTGTQFVVENRSADHWREVEVSVYSPRAAAPYVYRADAILAGRRLVIGALNFETGGGLRWSPFQLAPSTFSIAARRDDGRIGFTSGEVGEAAMLP